MNRHHPYGRGGFDGAPQRRGAPPGACGPGPDRAHDFPDRGGSSRGRGGWRGTKRGDGVQRREPEEKMPESVIEERIQRERPCRTLFIRNVKYETPSEDVRRLFEEYGEIKTFFNLIANRGMVFVTYFDLRAAERARKCLQGSEISGRPIDVHYSLPRDHHSQRGGDKEKNQQMQSILLITLRNSPCNQSISEDEVRRKFQQFGDVKSVSPVIDRNDQRYVEYYDTRTCEEAHDRLRHQGLQDGVMDIVFLSELDGPRAASPRRETRGFNGGGREWDNHNHQGRRGGSGAGRGRRCGCGGGHWDRRGGCGGGGGDCNRDRPRPFEDEYGRTLRGTRFENRYDGRGPGGSGSPGPGGTMPPPPAPPMKYSGGPPPLPPTYFQPPPVAPPADDRLEQAKKLQQLLDALKQPVQGGAAAPLPPPDAQGPPTAMPPVPPMPLGPNEPPFYPPLPGGYGGPLPGAYPSPPSAPPPPGVSYPPPSPPGAGIAGLPPNLLALLQQGAPSQKSTPPGPPPPPGNAPYSMPPPGGQPGGPPPSNAGSPNGQGYQQLMAYLQAQKRA